MGTWGAGIFADDLAADVRDDWREAILDGVTPEAATIRLVERHHEAVEDVDDSPVFWLALAAAQEQTGRLQPDVRDRALAIIAAGGDVARFADQDAGLAKARAKALDGLAAKLMAPSKPPTRMVRPRAFASPLEIGDVVRVPSSETSTVALLVVVDIAEAYPPGSTQPVLAALAWQGGPIPSPTELARLPLFVDDMNGHEPRKGGPFAILHAVLSPPRGKLAMPESVEVVARGVLRPDAPDHRLVRQPGAQRAPNFMHASWPTLSAWIGSEWFLRDMAMTLERAKRSWFPRLPGRSKD